jgi:hypothetical protein
LLLVSVLKGLAYTGIYYKRNFDKITIAAAAADASFMYAEENIAFNIL